MKKSMIIEQEGEKTFLLDHFSRKEGYGSGMKEKKVFFCKECGYESAKWLGQCPGCRQWNTFAEEKITVKKRNTLTSSGEKPEAVSITEVTSAQESRMFTNIGELDRVLGGGIVRGSLVLVGGDPGIGKSTLLLEMCKALVADDEKVLYVSGEESLSQIKMRGVRLGAYDEKILLLSDGDLTNAENAIEKTGADVAVIDSIQTMFVSDLDNVPGSVTQVREVTSRLMQIAKRLNVAIFIVGHVTKEGTVAGHDVSPCPCDQEHGHQDGAFGRGGGRDIRRLPVFPQGA